jgi:regulator of RNase E activity RraA
MDDGEFTLEELEALRRFDTPTICNAIEMIMPEMYGIGFTTGGLVCAHPSLPPVVGYARTAMMRASSKPARTLEERRQHRFGYVDYIAQGPGPRIMVVQDVDPVPGFGAWWGEVNTAVHKGLGCAGAVTNGSFRDVDLLAEGFQLLGGCVGPAAAHVQITDYDCEVNIGGMVVKTNDIIHADRHGAVVVPAGCVRGIPAAVELALKREKVILDAVRSPGFGPEALKRAYQESWSIN